MNLSLSNYHLDSLIMASSSRCTNENKLFLFMMCYLLEATIHMRKIISGWVSQLNNKVIVKELNILTRKEVNDFNIISILVENTY